MALSKTRLKEINSIPDSEIDTSDIPELGSSFFEKAILVTPHDSLLKATVASKDEGKGSN